MKLSLRLVCGMGQVHTLTCVEPCRPSGGWHHLTHLSAVVADELHALLVSVKPLAGRATYTRIEAWPAATWIELGVRLIQLVPTACTFEVAIVPIVVDSPFFCREIGCIRDALAK